MLLQIARQNDVYLIQSEVNAAYFEFETSSRRSKSFCVDFLGCKTFLFNPAGPQQCNGGFLQNHSYNIKINFRVISPQWT